ncbi:MAG TPA: hypothetical protein VLA95_00585 [Gemmatimonadales bacterium]|nr:hypothetical protein [Gemmatimonadales bacterium]
MRRALAARGVRPASGEVEAGAGRAEAAEVRPGRVVEGTTLEARPVGPPEPMPGPVAFLDGIQRQELLGYVGTMPLVWAEVAAGVRVREGRRFSSASVVRARLLVGRPEALAAAGAAEGLEPVPLPDDGPLHPVRDLQLARAAVDARRGALERMAGEGFRAGSDAWLVVDGSLAESPAWARDPRMLGVVKSHASLPFDGADQLTYLGLPFAHRTSVFAPASRAVAPVWSWALRLWPSEGRDLLHGLVRVEACPGAGTLAAADRVSRWLLAERTPIAGTDRRWDRLLYGIHEVERALRAGR